MPAWGGPLRTPKNWFFERFYIIKSNWKSSSLFCLLFPLASCCRTLPLDKGKKRNTSMWRWPYEVYFFLRLTSYNNILCISRPMVLPKAVVSKICEGYVHWVLQLGNACVRGTLTNPKNWFFERFYIIKSNWKSSSLFCLLFPLASCCRTLPLDKGKKRNTSMWRWPYEVYFFLRLTSYNNILCISRPMVLPKAVVSKICEGYVHWVLQLGNACVRGTLTNPQKSIFWKVLHNKK